jgi:hypothetical protein
MSGRSLDGPSGSAMAASMRSLAVPWFVACFALVVACSEPDGPCVANDDCGATEVCAAFECVDAMTTEYRVSIDKFAPWGCEDVDGSISVDIRIDEAVMDTWVSAACPARFAEDFLYTPGSVLRFAWSAEELPDKKGVCFVDSYYVCLPVPVDVLHAGRYGGAIGSNYIELTFTPSVLVWPCGQPQ